MTTTAFVDVPAGTWTEIMGISLTNVVVSNEGGGSLMYVNAGSAPADTDRKGHTLNTGEKVTLSTGVGEHIYARPKGDSATFIAKT